MINEVHINIFEIKLDLIFFSWRVMISRKIWFSHKTTKYYNKDIGSNLDFRIFDSIDDNMTHSIHKIKYIYIIKEIIINNFNLMKIIFFRDRVIHGKLGENNSIAIHCTFSGWVVIKTGVSYLTRVSMAGIVRSLIAVAIFKCMI